MDAKVQKMLEEAQQEEGHYLDRCLKVAEQLGFTAVAEDCRKQKKMIGTGDHLDLRLLTTGGLKVGPLRIKTDTEINTDVVQMAAVLAGKA